MPKEQPRMSNPSITLCLAGLLALPSAAFGRYALELETGMATASRNDIRIPGDSGTKFSLVDDLDSDSAAYFRGRLGVTLADRHVILFTAAPLRLEASGELDRDILFDRFLIPAGTAVEADYQFDSYRLTYRYSWQIRPSLRIAAGATAFVRDAEVKLEGGGYTAVYTNVGLVPLLSFNVDWQFADRLSLVIDGDAMAVSQGRAEDVLFAVRYHAGERLDLHMGYRIIEGGADNDEVYTFALVNLWSLGATLHF